MEKGLAVIERTDTATRGFFIDQDTIEFARLNADTKKRIAHAEAVRRMDDLNRRKAEKEKAQRKAYNLNTVKRILIHGGIIGAVVWAGTAGMIHPAICIPVALFCLCAVCLRLGAWFGRGAKK